MESLFEAYLSWFQFLMIALVIAAVYFLLKRNRDLVQRLLRVHNLSLVNSIALVLLIVAFVMVNPTIHGMIVVLALLLFYPVLTAYIKGIIVTNNSEIETGDLVTIGKHTGKVADINLAGLKLLSANNNLFIPFQIVGTEVIEKYKSDQTRYISFLCKQHDKAGNLTVQDLEETIFNFHFLEMGSSIEINHTEYGYDVNVTLANDRFKTSLFNQLGKAGFDIIQKENAQ